MSNKLLIGSVVLSVILSALSLYVAVAPSLGSKSFGSLGVKLAENYDPYLRYNGGYYSNLPIQTTSTLQSAGFTATTGTFTGAITGTSATFSGLLTSNGGQLRGNTNATSTVATTQTLTVTDLQAYDTVILTPNVGTVALTLPASSTAATWLPAAGNAQDTCFMNGTTTAGVFLTFAGGTGTNLQVASSSATALGSTKIGPQKVGCFHFVRGNATATTFDIQSAFTAYQ